MYVSQITIFLSVENLRATDAESLHFHEEVRKKNAERTPLNRVSRPADIAEGILALLRLDFVTGHVLVIDGGQSVCS